MRPIVALACILSTLLTGAASAVVPQQSRPLYREGELLVKYRSRADSPEARQLRERHGLVSLRRLRRGRVELLRLPAMTTVAGAVAALRDHPAVKYAEPAYLLWPHAAEPDDPLFDQQWGLLNTGQDNFFPDGPAGEPDADLHVLDAWQADGDAGFERTGTGVKVAIVDDGFQLDHPDLAFVEGFDTVDGDTDPSPGIDDEHGTTVAGCIGAIGNNGKGVAGTAWGADLIPVRFDYRVESEPAAFDAAVARGARIINASYGSPAFSATQRDVICGDPDEGTDTDSLAAQGVLLVVAAGNDDSNLDYSVASYPANYDCPNVVAVAATNRQDGIASFSQHGALSTDVAAPGLQIVTTRVGSGYTEAVNCGDPGGACGVSGTSFAAPYVAGIAALILQEYPAATPREIRARLIEGADPGENPSADEQADLRSAGGRANAAASIALPPGPSLVIREVEVVDADGNARLDPGESLQLRITLENLWLAATGVSGSLASPAPVTSGTSEDFGDIPAGGTASATFDIAVADAAGYHDVFFSLAITADGGYAATRHFNREVAEADAAGTVSATLRTGLHDEFHTWHVDVPAFTDGNNGLRLTTTSSASGAHASRDLDVLVKRGAPARYNISIGVPPGEDAVFFHDADFVAGGADGNEDIRFEASPGTYYLTVVYYGDNDDPEDDDPNPYTLALEPTYVASGGGGGAMGSCLLGALAGLVLCRRRA